MATINTSITTKVNPLDFYAQCKRTGNIFHVYEGTGDNLLQEDIDEGYVDYLNYDYYGSIEDIAEDSPIDGGMILLKKLYQDMTFEEIIQQVNDFEDADLVFETKNNPSNKVKHVKYRLVFDIFSTSDNYILESEDLEYVKDMLDRYNNDKTPRIHLNGKCHIEKVITTTEVL